MLIEGSTVLELSALLSASRMI